MIQVIKTDIMEKYQTLPIMIAEETGESIEYVLDPTTDKVWHYYFLGGKSSIKPDTDIAIQWDSKIYNTISLVTYSRFLVTWYTKMWLD